MKVLIIVAVVLIGLAALFLVGRVALVFVSSGKSPAVVSTTTFDRGALLCSLTLVQSDGPMVVTSLDVTRVQADAVGLSTPEGFTVEPLIDDGSDPEYTKRWNLENIRFVGSLSLVPSVPTILRIPISSDGSLPLLLKGRIEAKWGMGGTMSFFRVVHPVPAATGAGS